MTLNYQYPLAAAIYKIIQRADGEYAKFLHDTGYKKEGKSFKLFTFSDIRIPFAIQDDRMLMKEQEALLIVCFHLPDAAGHFIKGLFMNQELEVADKKSKVTFRVQQVESVQVMPVHATESSMKVTLQPLSPLVTGWKNDRGHYDYLRPQDANFTHSLLHNWLEKYSAVYDTTTAEIEMLKDSIKINVRLFPHPPQQRLITIKAGTDAATKLRGYMKFQLVIEAPARLIEMAMGSGLGLYNAMGMGCVGIV